MIDRSKAQIFPQPYPSASCDSYLCRQRSKWFVGRPDGPLNLCLKLCDDCLKNVVESLPEGFKPAGIPEGMVMVDEATYKEMEQAAASIPGEYMPPGVPEGVVMVDEATYKEMEQAAAAIKLLQDAAEQAPKVGAKKA